MTGPFFFVCAIIAADAAYRLGSPVYFAAYLVAYLAASGLARSLGKGAPGEGSGR